MKTEKLKSTDLSQQRMKGKEMGSKDNNQKSTRRGKKR
jgi:hypothetical protein